MNFDGPTLPLARRERGEIKCPECGATLEGAPDSGTTQVECSACHTAVLVIGVEGSLVALQEQLGDRFRLLEQLGQGSFGAVWRGFDQQLNREVALKLPVGYLDAVAIDRFLHEARAAAGLNHPGIVGVYDVGVQGNQVFIVNELISGVSLAEYRRLHRLEPRRAAELCARICEALQVAHGAGVIHRDLKPANIMIDADGNPHVADFGLAKSTAIAVTATVDGQVLGTPAYMSPEQAAGRSHETGPPADLYAVGVILFELLTGERPFRGSLQAILRQIVHDEPPFPRSLRPSVPRDLETICLKCLRKNPSDRFQSAQELADELRRFLGGIPIHSRAVTRFERSVLWCQRNPALTISLTLVIASLTIGIVISSVLGWQAHKSGELARNLADRRQALIGELGVTNRRLESEKAAVEFQRSRAEENAKLAEARAEELRRKLYHTGIANAWKQWERREYALVLQTLESLRPQEGESDLRELVWHHLWGKLHAYDWEMKSYQDLLAPVPNTDRVVLASRGKASTFKLLDVETQTVLQTIRTEGIAKLSVADDSQTIASLLSPRRLQMFRLDRPDDIRVFDLPFEFYQPGDALFSHLEFAGSPEQVLISHYPLQPTSASAHEISLYDTQQQAVLQAWPAADSSFDFQEGRLVFLAPADEPRRSVLTSVDLRDGERLELTLSTASTGRFSGLMLRWISPTLCVLSEGDRLTAYRVAEDGIREAWQVTLPEQVTDLLEIRFQNRLLVKLASGHAVLLASFDGKLISELPGFEEPMIGIRYAVLQRSLSLLASDGRRLRRWPLVTLPPDPLSLDGVRANELGTLGFQQVGQATTDLLWLPRDAAREPRKLRLPRQLHHVALHPKRAFAMVVTYDDSWTETYLELIDLEQGSSRALLEETPQRVASVSFSATGDHFLVVGQAVETDGLRRSTDPLQIRQFPGGELLREIKTNVSQASYGPDENRLFMVVEEPTSGSNQLQVMDGDSGALLWQSPVRENAESYTSLSFSADGLRWILGCQDGTVEIRSLENYERRSMLRGDRRISGTVQADQEHLWTLEEDSTVRYWDLVNDEEVLSFRLPPLPSVFGRNMTFAAGVPRLGVEPRAMAVGDVSAEQRLAWYFATIADSSDVVVAGEGLPGEESQRQVGQRLDQLEPIASGRDPLSPSDLELFRSAWQEWRTLRLDRERRERTREQYAVFLFWLADFLARYEQEHGPGELRMSERPYPAYARAKLYWSSLGADFDPRRQIMMAGLQNNCARYLMSVGRYGNAIFHLGDAIAIQRTVLARHPGLPQARAFMKNHLTLMLKAKVADGEFDDAWVYVKEMIALDPADLRLVDAALDFTTAVIVAVRQSPESERAEREDRVKEELRAWWMQLPQPTGDLTERPSFQELESLVGPALIKEWLAKP